MAPIEDLHSRDLEWISDFVMQQMVIMLRPMMDQLQDNDMSVENAQRAVHRLCQDVSEVRGDLERTNKYLSSLRQGLGVQNESKCMLQRSMESSTRTVKRLDDQMDGMLEVIRGMQDSIGKVHCDVRGAGLKHEELAKLVVEGSSNMEDLQAKIERVSNDAHSVKDGLLNNEARFEVWQREIRELRLNQRCLVPKLEDKAGRPPPSSRERSQVSKFEDKKCRSPPSSRGCGPPAPDSWPPKKSFSATTPVDMNGGGPGPANTSVGIGGLNEGNGGKRLGRVGGSSGSNAYAFSLLASDVDDSCGTSFDETPSSSRLPTLAISKQPSVTRPPEGSYSTGPRLRFSETMAKPPSRETYPQG